MYRLIQRVYNETIRDHLPTKYRVLSGVAINDTPLLDMTASDPNHKQGLLDAINEHVKDGDHVEIIGGGRGVSTIYCLDAGADHVTAYEASQSMIDTWRHTLEINRVPAGTAEIRHVLVGEAIEVYGDLEGAKRVPPSSLSDADVLILDCEGAEKSILSDLGTEPGIIICETHPERGVPTSTIKELLTDREVSERQYEPGDETEKRVLVATDFKENPDE